MVQQGIQTDLRNAIVSFESTAMNYGFRFIPDNLVRAEYNMRAKQLSAEIIELVNARKITNAEGARRANEMRNVLMDALRGKSSEIGQAYAVSKKRTGKTLTQLQEHYATAKYKRSFSALSSVEKNMVWGEIVCASGRPQLKANQLARVFGVAGRGFVFVTIAIATYNILSAEDKIMASANESAVLGGGLLGSVAGGAVAGLACGPGAPVCVGIGVFVGGVMFAIGAQITFDSFWR